MIYKLLKSFQESNIQVWSEDGKIKFSGPKDKITNEFIATLKANKELLIQHFENKRTNNNKTIATKNQMALWIERKLGSVDGTIHNGMIKVMSGNLDYQKIKTAFINVIKRHEALRSTFYEESGEVYINLGEIKENFFSVEDLTYMGFQESYQYVTNQINETMDLMEGPLFRVGVYQVEDDLHILGLWAHHIISDAYSLFIIEKEFYQFYDELLNENKHVMDRETFYFNSIKEEQHYLGGSQYIKDMEYWRQSLDVTIIGSSLPKYKVESPDEYHYRPATFTDTYSKELSTVIQSAARECQTTVYMLVFAMFNLAMNQFSEGKKTSLGLFTSNRLEEEHRSMVGYFSNAVVFQQEMDENLSILEYVKKVKTQILQMLSHQQTPFTSLVSELNPNREQKNPLFSVAFDSLLIPKDPQVKQLQEKLNITDHDLVKGSGEYDLIIWISEIEESYSLEYRYNSILFDEYQIRAFAETLEGLMGIACCQQNMVLSEVPVLYGNSKKVIEEINFTDVDFGELYSFAILRKQWLQVADRTAISCSGEEITYHEMEALISYFCKALREKGVEKGDGVGILLEKSCYLIPTILSVWAVGGIYVPIDPYFPVKRKEYIISNTNLSLILTEGTLKDDLDTSEIFIDIKEIVNEWRLQNKRSIEEMEELNVDVEEDSTAYIIYTSGSTGQPKGVVISHGAFMNFLRDMVTNISLNKNDKVLALTSICFDISLLELFLPLLVGAEVVMLTHNQALDGRKILEKIIEKGVTVMQATPTSYEMLYDFYDKGGFSQPLLKSCLCGGEGYELNLVGKIQIMSERVFNVYGPTETTIWSTIYEFPHSSDNLLIGRPIANTRVKVVNKYGLPLPLGVPGELVIGGSGLFKGYYNNDTATAGALISLSSADVYYKTGDWAYFNEDGMLKFLGRRDSQVKIRGFRIELSEIENVLKKYEGIKKVAVVTIDENGNQSLVAAVVPKDNTHLVTQNIMDFSQKYLPEYMMPSQILTVDQLPMTANGKIDKAVIRQMIISLISSRDNIEVAATEEMGDLEKQIKATWEKILKKPVHSINIGFFEAGGNSLLLNKLVAELEEIFERKIDIIQLLKFSSIKRMAFYISERDGLEINKADNKLQNVNRRSQYLKNRKR